MKEQQQVPPGIVAFEKNGHIYKRIKSEYERWAGYHLRGDASTIHSISVDGKEWSLQEKMFNNCVITAFIWSKGEWLCELDNRYDPKYRVTALTQPGEVKEESFGGKEVTILDLVEEKRKLQAQLATLRSESFSKDTRIKQFEALVNAQDDYLKFLGREIDRTAVYLHIHNMDCPSEIVYEGVDHRIKIDEIKTHLK